MYDLICAARFTLFQSRVDKTAEINVTNIDERQSGSKLSRKFIGKSFWLKDCLSSAQRACSRSLCASELLFRNLEINRIEALADRVAKLIFPVVPWEHRLRCQLFVFICTFSHFSVILLWWWFLSKFACGEMRIPKTIGVA